MKIVLTTFGLFVAFVSHSWANEAKNSALLLEETFQPLGKIKLYKDPFVATYLSATLPGLGQRYVGSDKRGFLFLAATIGAFGSAIVFYKPAELTVADYDKTDFGGDGDGILSVTEALNWQGKKFEDESFGRLSTTRKVGAVTGLVAGIGLYIWNIFDAHTLANDHNRLLVQRKVNLGLQVGPDQAALAFKVNF